MQRGSGSQAYKFPREAVNFEFPYYHPSRLIFGSRPLRKQNGRLPRGRRPLLIALVDRERECGRSGYDYGIIGARNGDRVRPGRCSAAATSSTASPASR